MQLSLQALFDRFLYRDMVSMTQVKQHVPSTILHDSWGFKWTTILLIQQRKWMMIMRIGDYPFPVLSLLAWPRNLLSATVCISFWTSVTVTGDDWCWRTYTTSLSPITTPTIMWVPYFSVKLKKARHQPHLRVKMYVEQSLVILKRSSFYVPKWKWTLLFKYLANAFGSHKERTASQTWSSKFNGDCVSCKLKSLMNHPSSASALVDCWSVCHGPLNWKAQVTFFLQLQYLDWTAVTSVSLAKDPKYKILQIKLESFQLQVVFLKGTFLNWWHQNHGLELVIGDCNLKEAEGKKRPCSGSKYNKASQEGTNESGLCSAYSGSEQTFLHTILLLLLLLLESFSMSIITNSWSTKSLIDASVRKRKWRVHQQNLWQMLTISDACYSKKKEIEAVWRCRYILIGARWKNSMASSSLQKHDAVPFCISKQKLWQGESSPYLNKRQDVGLVVSALARNTLDITGDIRNNNASSGHKIPQILLVDFHQNRSRRALDKP